MTARSAVGRHARQALRPTGIFSLLKSQAISSRPPLPFAQSQPFVSKDRSNPAKLTARTATNAEQSSASSDCEEWCSEPPRSYSPLNPGQPIISTCATTVPSTANSEIASAVNTTTSSAAAAAVHEVKGDQADRFNEASLYPIYDPRAVPSINAFNPISYDISTEGYLFDDAPPSADLATDNTVIALAGQHTYSSFAMADDASYEAFLSKAQSDAQPAVSTQTHAKPGDRGIELSATQAPPKLKTLAERVYTSDSDEPFEPFTLPFRPGSAAEARGGLDVHSFAESIGVEHKHVKRIGVQAFDPKENYTDVVETVKSAGVDTVEVFEVKGDGGRMWYWLCGIMKEKGEHGTEGSMIAGVRVLSVES